MAIENREQPKPAPQPSVEFEGEINRAAMSKINFGSTVVYDVVIRTRDPKALALQTLRADTIVKVKVEPKNEPKAANTTQQRK